jgi:enoyl-CoA hydratase/carnithine racemase
MSAEEAKEWGLVDHVYSTRELPGSVDPVTAVTAALTQAVR